MRKVTQNTTNAFNNKKAAKESNTVSTGEALYLHGNKIAWWEGEDLYISSCGWVSNVTRERLNGVTNVSLSIKNRAYVLNGQPWNGSPIKIN